MAVILTAFIEIPIPYTVGLHVWSLCCH